MRRTLLVCLLALSFLPVSFADAGGWRFFCRRPIFRARCCCCCPTYPQKATPSVDYSRYPVESFVDANGIQRYAILSNESDDYEESASIETPRSALGLAQRTDEQRDSDTYAGTAREAAKTADGRADYYSSIPELLDDLPSDNSMRNRRPRISSGRNSDRVDVENRNVTVDAYLYAASGEEDNDFHLIIGTSGRRSQRTYLNVEISGLPRDRSSDDYDDLERVRNFYKSYFGRNVPGDDYDIYKRTPFRVRVTGSLFYDISHAPGVVGPRNYKPDTAWEIHPVTFIEFLDN